MQVGYSYYHQSSCRGSLGIATGGMDLAPLPAMGQLSSLTDYELGPDGAWLVYLI